MKRKALLIGNSSGLPGVKLDLKKFKIFLSSNIGGAWDDNEIILLPNANKFQLNHSISLIKKEINDYCIVYFSGHGGFKRQTILELSDNTIIPESFLDSLSPKQLNIFDCCRSAVDLVNFNESKIAAESIDSSKREREYFRHLYNAKINLAIPQQVKLYSCAIGEISNDTSSGGVYTQALLDAAHLTQTVGTAHAIAADSVNKRWNNHHDKSKQQHPEAILPKCLSFQQLIISLANEKFT